MGLLTSFFHFVLIKPGYGVLSKPPVVVSRHQSLEPLISIFRNNVTTGVHEYDSNHGLFHTRITKDGKTRAFWWPHSSVLDRFLDPSRYLKLDIFGSMVRLDIDSGQKEVYDIGLERGDYLTCADFWKRKGLAVSFNNRFYLFDEREVVLLTTLSLDTGQFLYATNMKSFWRREGPVHVLIRFQKGGFIYLRFLDVNALKDVKILEKTMLSYEDALDFDLDDQFIYVLDSKKKLIVSSIKDREKSFVIPLKTSFSAISVCDREIHLFDPSRIGWSTLRPSAE